MSWFDLDIDGFKYLSNLETSNTQAIVVHAKLDEGSPLNIVMATDWAAVVPSAASVVVALIIAALTVRVQRNQIQGNISTLRHHWMNELRSCSAELLKQMIMLINHMKQRPEYLGSPGYVEYMNDLVILENKIILLLSRDSSRTRSIIERVDGLLREIDLIEFDSDTKKIFEQVDELRVLLRQELEGAWGDIKRDLGVNTTFLGFKIVRNK